MDQRIYEIINVLADTVGECAGQEEVDAKVFEAMHAIETLFAPDAEIPARSNGMFHCWMIFGSE